MPEIRASHIGAEYDPERSDPVPVMRDEHGVLRTVKYERRQDYFVNRGLKAFGEVLVLEADSAGGK